MVDEGGIFESIGNVEGTRKVTVGRIAYCVFAAVPLALFLRLLLDPGQTKDERFSDFLQFWLLAFVNVPVVLVGIAILIWQRVRRNPVLFWFVAVLIAATPIFCEIGLNFLLAIADVHVPPFT
jgi:cytochrome bd-type quinol oxidase subunit 2